MEKRSNGSKNRNSEKSDKTEKKKSSKGRQPDYRVVVAKEKDDSDEVFWTRIGSAWEIKDGGISISLNALPLGDRITLFPNTDDEEESEE